MIKKTIVIMVCTFMLFSAGNCVAGLFAKGGGDSQNITSISPTSVFNTTGQTLTLTGRFSKKQSRNRRVVLSLDRLPTPRPIHVYKWKRDQITVQIPSGMQPGRYHIFLERARHDHGRTQWEAISNQMSFRILGSTNSSRNGAPHAAPISIRDTSLCSSNSTVSRWITGGPFQLSGRAYQIRAELRATPPLPSYIRAPLVDVKSATLVEVKNIPCFITFQNPTLELRLIYPDGSKSNWGPAADNAIRQNNNSGSRRTPRRLQPITQ